MNQMTQEEKLAIMGGENLHLETVHVEGVYANGVRYEREYKLDINMRQSDTFNLSLKISYHDPLAAAMNP